MKSINGTVIFLATALVWVSGVASEAAGVRSLPTGKVESGSKTAISPIISGRGGLDRRLPLATGALLAATFLGGSGCDANQAVVATDAEGHVFVADWTQSSNFPVTPGCYQHALGGGYDLYVAKLSRNLDTLLACTYLGGSRIEGDWPGIAMQVAADNTVYVCGMTNSTDFPTTSGCYRSINSGGNDCFVVRLNNSLTTLLASTYVGGGNDDAATAMVLSSDGSVFIAGQTSSDDFPYTSGAFDTTRNGTPYDVFVAKFDANLTHLDASTYLGGTKSDYVEDIRFGKHGGVYVAGWTASTNFPVTASAFQKTYGGYYYDGFVSCLSDDLTQLRASTYLGGSSWDFVYALVIDSGGRVITAGQTASRSGFPTSHNAFDSTYNSTQGPDYGDDAFVTIFDSSLSTVQASTYFGGQGWENGYGLLLFDSLILVSGSTSSADLPTTPGAFDRSYNGGTVRYAGDAFLAAFNPSLSKLVSSTFIGGQSTENGHALASSADSNVYFVGGTSSVDFPATPGAVQPTFGGGDGQFGGDGFICLVSRLCYADGDHDGAPDISDNCLAVANPGQEDADGDGIGDACDQCTDTDHDGFGDPGYPGNSCAVDNCPHVGNPGQKDANHDGIGDACCCVGKGGNVDCDVNNGTDISDLSALIDNLYISLAPLCCTKAANVDGSLDGNIDISDLSALIDYLYISFTPPASCL